MADPSRPTVPDAAGVPPLNRTASTTPASVIPETVDTTPIVVTAQVARWSIHLENGDNFFPKHQGPDSYVEVEDSADWSIPNYPTEEGGFESYNKVKKPGEVHLTLSKGGTISERQGFRQRIDGLAEGLDLVSIITPGRVYKGYNLTRVDSMRTAEKGANLIQLRLVFTQVRTTVRASFTNVQDASAAANTNGGAVQPAPPTPTQSPKRPPQ